MLSASGTGSPPNRLPPPARSRTSHTVILFLHIHRLFKTLSKDRNYFVKIPFHNPGLSRTDRGTNHTARTAHAREQKYRTAIFPRGTAACSTNQYPSTYLLPCFLFRKRSCVSPDSRMLPGHHATKNEMFSEHDGGTRKTNGQSPDTTFRKRTRHCGFRRKDAGRPASAAPVIPPKAERYGRKRRFPAATAAGKRFQRHGVSAKI